MYALTSGSYSDYQVHCVFEREDDAEAAAALGGDYEVVGLPLYRAGERPTRVITHWQAEARLYDETPLRVEGMHTHATTHWSWEGEPQYGPDRPRFGLLWIPPRSDRAGWWSLSAVCRDRDLALKSVQDNLAELKARRSGVADG